MAKFFVDAFEMEIAERRASGAIDLSDGTMNITILTMTRPRANGRPARPGIDHMGFTVEDDELYTRSWTGEFSMTRHDGPVYEYACHEGNYSLANALRSRSPEEAAR